MKIEQVTLQDAGKPRLKAILRALAGKRILVIGDVGVDRYTIGSVERISPEAPVPIVFVEEENHKLGLAANVADNVKVLGGDPQLVGVVGADRAAQDLRKLLKKAGISGANLVADSKRRTILKERIVSDRQQLLRVDYETPTPISSAVERRVFQRLTRALRTCDAVIVEDYAKGLLTADAFARIFQAARKARKIAAADPNPKTSAECYRGAWVLTPNTREAEHLAGSRIRDEASLLEAGQKILKSSRAEHVVITRGKDGMAIFSARSRGRVFLIPTYAREVYDVSGAGDTVISVLTLALAAGATIVEAALLGNVAAGIEVGKRGTATVSPREILESLDRLV